MRTERRTWKNFFFFMLTVRHSNLAGFSPGVCGGWPRLWTQGRRAYIYSINYTAYIRSYRSSLGRLRKIGAGETGRGRARDVDRRVCLKH